MRVMVTCLSSSLSVVLINDIGENGGKLSIDYTVEIDSNLAGTHRFEMAVTPAGKMQ